MTVTIYHNPKCGTSRNTLAMIRQSGVEPEVIEYLQNPPSKKRLGELIKAMGITPRELLRRKGTPYDELGLDDPKWTDKQLIDLMLQHPILINRPIVVTPRGARLCRPSEVVLDILENPDIGTFKKEDGAAVVARPRAGGLSTTAAKAKPSKKAPAKPKPKPLKSAGKPAGKAAAKAKPAKKPAKKK